MVKCQKCGTGWTSSGLPLCPVCGTKVDPPAPVAEGPAARKNGSSVVPAPPEVRNTEPHPYVLPMPEAAAQEAGRKPASAVLDVPVESPKAEPTRPKSKPICLPILPRQEPPILRAEPPPAALEAPPEPPKTEIRRPDPPMPEPFIFQTLKRAERPARAASVTLKEKPVDMEPIDASAANLPVQALKELRTASRPLNGPLILGCLAYVAVVMLPITMAFESHRVIGVLGFTLAGFFAPFAPIAWLAGLAAEKRRRDQGLRPEGRVTLGRLLGQWGTLLLTAQVTFGLIAIAAMRLSAKFPPSFWRGEF
jgi:hypothetical protein